MKTLSCLAIMVVVAVFAVSTAKADVAATWAYEGVELQDADYPAWTTSGGPVTSGVNGVLAIEGAYEAKLPQAIEDGTYTVEMRVRAWKPDFTPTSTWASFIMTNQPPSSSVPSWLLVISEGAVGHPNLTVVRFSTAGWPTVDLVNIDYDVFATIRLAVRPGVSSGSIDYRLWVTQPSLGNYLASSKDNFSFSKFGSRNNLSYDTGDSRLDIDIDYIRVVEGEFVDISEAIAPVWAFGGPQGIQGLKGDKGDKGDPGEITLEELDNAIEDHAHDKGSGSRATGPGFYIP